MSPRSFNFGPELDDVATSFAATAYTQIEADGNASVESDGDVNAPVLKIETFMPHETRAPQKTESEES